MEKIMVHPIVIEHIQILEQYFSKQKELFELVKEKPEGEFEENEYNVRLMELDRDVDRLSERLNESVQKLGTITYRNPSILG